VGGLGSNLNSLGDFGLFGGFGNLGSNLDSLGDSGSGDWVFRQL
jgi:hypothetical protein